MLQSKALRETKKFCNEFKRRGGRENKKKCFRHRLGRITVSKRRRLEGSIDKKSATYHKGR